MAFVQAQVNTWDFSEVTDGTGLGDAQPQVTNSEGRAVENYEILMQGTAPFYCGEVREFSGIADSATGRINIEHRRVIRTSQIKTDTTTFAVDAEVFFSPGGSGAAGEIVVAADKAAGDIKYGRITAIGGSTGAYTWLEIRPYAFDEARILEV